MKMPSLTGAFARVGPVDDWKYEKKEQIEELPKELSDIGNRYGEKI